MNIHHVLFFCFLSGSLCDEDDGSPRHIRGTEGESISVGFSFPLVEIGRKFLCRAECKEEDVLVETRGFEKQKGRYGLKYERNSQLLYVSIAQLRKSDAGWYRCGVRRPLLPDSYEEFEVSITDFPITTPETSKESASSSPPVLLVLGVCVPVVVVAVLLAVVLLFLHKKKTRGILECTKTENFPPVSTCEDTYQSLDLTSRDKDQIYSTLTQTQHK
ncbi:uncharacterized protein LOC127376943 isoform X2 [Dicentrarchus labrax]|uniref:uncharacterized protein LOC127376943 isoform X2 n=1 Tax=Dicentrarchus labrax TaxID=13489 RepID=UPI0021F55132|nr:uncharacterized protein LOC127376943 isoform X2 [Dicentrarchus labrax]